jgi:transcriptional regulator with XRE-family HTH domain
MTITEKIIALRTEKKIKSSEVAYALEMTQSNYARLEKRDKDLSINQLESIAVALGVTVNEILHYGEEKTQIVDNEKVKELENRIKELESIIKDKEIIITLLLDKTNGDMENINAIFDAMIADKKRLGGDTKDVEQMEKLKTKFNLVNNKFISNIFNENNTR